MRNRPVILLLLISLIWQTPSIYAAKARTGPDDNHPKRIIAYFPEWAAEESNKGNFTVSMLPGEKITHINYSFARINNENKIDFGSKEAAIVKDYPDQLSDLSFKGHLNQLVKFKRKFSHVKTLVSVGGWDYSKDFYRVASSADARTTFANSVVEFLKNYQFDGIDIDWEFPSATYTERDGGSLSKEERAKLPGYYRDLLKTIRQKFTNEEKKSGKAFLLTASQSASSSILSGMDMGKSYAHYLDWINVMAYDFHGSWNTFVGPQSSLFPDSKDPETKNLPMPTLNVDWAVKYYLGIFSPQKIVIGVPLYSRGWKNVSGGENGTGLWGTAPLNSGADGEEGIWNDPPSNDGASSTPEGLNPIWQIKNLENRGGYQYFFDQASKTPYLWNAEKKVFLTYENEESLQHKADYIVENHLGGMMLNEITGDYAKKDDGTYGVGSTLTDAVYNRFLHADLPKLPKKPKLLDPLDFKFSFEPLNSMAKSSWSYAMKINNQTGSEIEAGWTIEFDAPKSTQFTSVEGASIDVTEKDKHFNHISITDTNNQKIVSGETIRVRGKAQLPMAGEPTFVTLNDHLTRDEYLRLGGKEIDAPEPDPKPEPTPEPDPVPEPDTTIIIPYPTNPPTVLVPQMKKDTSPPTKPSGLDAIDIQPQQLTLVWNESFDDVGVSQYEIYKNGKMIMSVTGTQANITGLEENKMYLFTIVAKDRSGKSSEPAYLLASTNPNDKPKQVEDIAWKAHIPYRIGDIVRFEDTFYINTVAHISMDLWKPTLQIDKLWKKIE